MQKKQEQSFPFRKIKELEHNRKITLGVNRFRANDFWREQTSYGKLFNLMTLILMILSVFSFIKYGFLIGFLSILVILIYVRVIGKIAGIYFRLCLLENEGLFNTAYNERSITIRDNRSGKVICFPDVWSVALIINKK